MIDSGEALRWVKRWDPQQGAYLVDRELRFRLIAQTLHESALRSAGFREVGTLWQHGSDRLLAAVR